MTNDQKIRRLIDAIEDISHCYNSWYIASVDKGKKKELALGCAVKMAERLLEDYKAPCS